MKVAWGLGIVGAVLLHLGILLFGGLLFGQGESSVATTQEVELLGAVEAQKPEEPQEEVPQEQELEQETESPPDPIDVAQSSAPSLEESAPALEAASLSAIEAALNQTGGGSDFGAALSFSSGGRIGGTGKAGGPGDPIETALGLSEFDQSARAIFQVAPLYPAELRRKNIDGQVTLIFNLDESGSVNTPKVAESSHPAFERPALEAIRQWRFEPRLQGGKRVPARMRLTMRFQPD